MSSPDAASLPPPSTPDEPSLLLETLLATAPVGFAYLDTKLRYRRINPSLAALNQRSPEEHIGRTVEEMAPNFAPRIVPLLRQVLDTGEPIPGWEISGRKTEDGLPPRSYLVGFYPLRREESVCGVGIVVTEITALRKAETGLKETADSLKESEARFRAVFENCYDAIGLGDGERLLACNGAYAALFGYPTPESMQGFPVEKVFAPGAAREVGQIAAQGTSGEDAPPTYETRGIRADGSEFDAEMRVSRYEQNGRRYSLAIVRDITARKQREKQAADAYDRERRIAQTLQNTMLLTAPQSRLPGLQVAPFYEAALPQESVIGGDFFDYLPLSEGRIALAVGDASGKGLAAAARTAEVKYVLRAYLYENNDPATALAKLNDYLCAAHQTSVFDTSDSFIALAVAVLDTGSGALQIAQAGAEPSLVLRKGGGVVSTEKTGGLPLGIVPGETYRTLQTILAPSDILLLMTDGLTEARARIGARRGDFFGQEGVLAAVEEAWAQGEDLTHIGRRIIAEAQAFASGALGDDVCLVLARREEAVRSVIEARSVVEAQSVVE